jgi:alpha-D-ribose 1-methylphosphonate 5-triphosphate synthase subunit PhnL
MRLTGEFNMEKTRRETQLGRFIPITPMSWAKMASVKASTSGVRGAKRSTIIEVYHQFFQPSAESIDIQQTKEVIEIFPLSPNAIVKVSGHYEICSSLLESHDSDRC